MIKQFLTTTRISSVWVCVTLEWKQTGRQTKAPCKINHFTLVFFLQINQGNAA